MNWNQNRNLFYSFADKFTNIIKINAQSRSLGVNCESKAYQRFTLIYLCNSSKKLKNSCILNYNFMLILVMNQAD